MLARSRMDRKVIPVFSVAVTTGSLSSLRPLSKLYSSSNNSAATRSSGKLFSNGWLRIYHLQPLGIINSAG